MAADSKIEWTDHTFNPWTGCTKVSAACDHCYAEGWAKRSGHVEWGPHALRRRTSPDYWKQPLKWNAKAEKEGVRRKVFCASLADVFDNHKSIEFQWRKELFKLIEVTPNLDWLLLTKRPQNMPKMLPPTWWATPLKNVWLGTTVENQEEADRRVPHLLNTPAAIRFLSCEPLLGPVDLGDIPWPSDRARFPETDDISDGRSALHMIEGTRIDWVIVGGESGHGARPMHPEFARNLRDQCDDADVPFFFKQHGDWIAGEPDAQPPFWEFQDGRYIDGHQLPDIECDDRWCEDWATDDFQGHAIFEKVGKKRAGRLLDGVEHNGMPEADK